MSKIYTGLFTGRLHVWAFFKMLYLSDFIFQWIGGGQIPDIYLCARYLPAAYTKQGITHRGQLTTDTASTNVDSLAAFLHFTSAQNWAKENKR